MEPEKAWYREPQWIAAVLTMVALFTGTIWSQASSEAQVRTNTANIVQIKTDMRNVPADISSIKATQSDQRDLLRDINNRLNQIEPRK